MTTFSGLEALLISAEAASAVNGLGQVTIRVTWEAQFRLRVAAALEVSVSPRGWDLSASGEKGNPFPEACFQGVPDIRRRQAADGRRRVIRCLSRRSPIRCA